MTSKTENLKNLQNDMYYSCEIKIINYKKQHKS